MFAEDIYNHEKAVELLGDRTATAAKSIDRGSFKHPDQDFLLAFIQR